MEEKPVSTERRGGGRQAPPAPGGWPSPRRDQLRSASLPPTAGNAPLCSEFYIGASSVLSQAFAWTECRDLLACGGQPRRPTCSVNLSDSGLRAAP